MCITTGRLGFGQVKQPNRDVAQPGSALAWGARGREFESRHPDPVKSRPQRDLGPCCFLMVYIGFKRNHQKHIEFGDLVDFRVMVGLFFGDIAMGCLVAKMIFVNTTSLSISRFM